MSDAYDFGETGELEKRESKLTAFLEQLFDEEERPYFVADDACVYDFFAGDDDEFFQRCEKVYGQRLNESDLRLPVWQLLDKLDK